MDSFKTSPHSPANSNPEIHSQTGYSEDSIGDDHLNNNSSRRSSNSSHQTDSDPLKSPELSAATSNGRGTLSPQQLNANFDFKSNRQSFFKTKPSDLWNKCCFLKGMVLFQTLYLKFSF